MHSQSTNWRIPERPEANPSVEKTRAWSLPQVLVSLQDSWSSLQQTLDGHLRMLVAVFSGYIYVRLRLDNIRCHDAVIDHLVFLIILGSRQANMFARKIELAIAKVVTSCPAHGRLPPANNGASKHINFCNWATWPNANMQNKSMDAFEAHLKNRHIPWWWIRETSVTQSVSCNPSC